MKKIIYLFFLLFITTFGENKVIVSYKENEPLLGKGHFLTFGKIPIATYENTTGYFSTVEIKGHNLEIKNNLKKIVIKNKGEILNEKEVEWNYDFFEIKNIDLEGLIVSLKWNNLEKDQIGVMINQWNLKPNNYEIEIDYHYENEVENLKFDINMPKFNPEIYLDINPNNPIIKKQEYNKDYLILKNIKLNHYDREITKNLESPEGIKVKLKSDLSIGNDEYLGIVELIPLTEKYPNIYVENVDKNDLFKNSEEVVIAVKLPKDLNFNSDYKIFGNLLEINYGESKKELLNKTLILSGKTQIKRTIALKNDKSFQNKIYLGNQEIEYRLLEKIGTIMDFYKNLKIRINENELLIDENGNSNSFVTPIGELRVENGRISLLLKNSKNFNQGEKISFEVLSPTNEILEEILLQLYLEN